MEPPESRSAAAEPAEVTPPPRPRTPADLLFTPRKSVRWFSPGTLAGAGARVVLSSAVGAYLDKRELQGVFSAQPAVGWADADDLWIDYVSDTGDGFDATYTMAWLIAQEQLRVPGVDRALPRGEVLVLGGDEVYPVAEATEYEDRFVGPFKASLPWTDAPRQPHAKHPEMYVLAGNHDWYDGLTSFMRMFCQGKWIGGRLTCQRRSYFALQLPHRWWLWGIDIQFDAYIDEPQQEYFKGVWPRMRPGDRVILCTAKPSWIDVRSEPGAFRNLAFVERKLIDPTGARLMVTLTGDSHHYAHYVDALGTHKVTSGGGGAFLHPTHDLEDSVQVHLDPADERSTRTYRLTACYPDRKTSRRTGLGAVTLPLRNPSFMVIPAAMYVLLGWASQFSLRAFESRDPLSESTARQFGWYDVLVSLARNPVSILLVALFVGALIAFAKPPPRWAHGRARLPFKIVMGVVHIAVHLVAIVVSALLAVRLASVFVDGGGWFTFLALAFMAIFGAVLGGLTTGLYLALVNVVVGAHGNEAFSAQRLTSYKNFLRLNIDRDGRLWIYPMGVRRSVRQGDWHLQPEGGPGDPWLAPPAGGAPTVHLIERPFVVDGR